MPCNDALRDGAGKDRVAFAYRTAGRYQGWPGVKQAIPDGY
jgi:hypothetical protein